MQTLRLTEHERTWATLTPEQLRDLRSAPRAVEVVEGANGRCLLQAGSIVGSIALPTMRLLIRPKVSVRNVFFLLAKAGGVRWSEREVPYETDDLLDAVAWWFDRECARAERFGLHHDYEERLEALPTLRGRLAIERQIALRPGRNGPIECRYVEHTEDTPLNRVVKAAHLALLRAAPHDRALTARLRHRARHMLGHVASVDYGGQLPDVVITRLARAWEPAYHLARLILRQQALRDEEGRVPGAAFTVDMNAVFERFVAAVVRERAEATGVCQVELQSLHVLARPVGEREARGRPVRMRPDLIIRRGGHAVAVGDAKYMQAPRSSDVYQLVAYCAALGVRRGVLVCAGRQPLAELVVPAASLTLARIGVDLAGAPHEILASAHRAADALLVQAEAGAAAVPAAAVG